MSNPIPSNGPATWTITQQIQTTGRAPSGQYVPGVRVAFAVDSGHSGEVFFPTAEYTPDNVRAKVEAAARLMRDIGNFSGQV